MFPVLLTSLFSYFLFKFDFYFFQDASIISQSSWLATFANSGWTLNFNPDFFKVINESLTTFFNGKSHYNSNLWTMKPEFIGSNFIFLLCFGFSFFSRRIFLLLLFLSSFLALLLYPAIFSFIIGFFLSTFILAYRSDFLIKNRILSFVLVFIGIYFLGYSIAEKDYLWITPFVNFKLLSTFIHTIGSSFLIFGVMTNRLIYDGLNGKISYFLGQISFPLYLIHILVISSISSYLYINLYQLGIDASSAIALTFFSLIFSSVFLSLPVIYLDRLWVNFINRFIASLVNRLYSLFTLQPK